MKHISFIESDTLSNHEKPVGAVISGERWDSVFIEVTLDTYITKQFQDWLRESVLTKLTGSCDAVRIAIKTLRLN